MYTTHRDVLEEIGAAVELPPSVRATGERIRELEAANYRLRGDVRQLLEEQRALATENLKLFHRAQVAEARLCIRRTQ